MLKNHRFKDCNKISDNLQTKWNKLRRTSRIPDLIYDATKTIRYITKEYSRRRIVGLFHQNEK
jgi:hypothetical protein